MTKITVTKAYKVKKRKLTVDRRFIENEYNDIHKWYDSPQYKQMMEKVATRPFYTK